MTDDRRPVLPRWPKQPDTVPEEDPINVRHAFISYEETHNITPEELIELFD